MIIDQQIPYEHPLENKARHAVEVVMYLEEVCPQIKGGTEELKCQPEKIFEYIKQNYQTESKENLQVEYAHILANKKTIDSPQRVSVNKKNAVIRLRVFNSAMKSSFLIDFGGLKASLLSTDGQLVLPSAPQSNFWIAVGQTLDIIIELDTKKGSIPVIAGNSKISLFYLFLPRFFFFFLSRIRRI